MLMSNGYLTPDLLGSLYLYSGSSRSNTSFTYVVSLTMAVDKDLLERVLNDLASRFPQLVLKAVVSGDSFGYEKSDCPAVVHDMCDRQAVSSSGEFGPRCLFSVFVNHKTVYFDFHKAITDEKGVVPFIRAVIYRYLKLGGYDVENDGSVITAESEFHDIEADDAFVKLDDIPASKPIWYMDAKAVCLPFPDSAGGFKVTRIHLPVAKIKGEAKDYVSMPSTIVSPFFAQALLDTYPEKDVAGEFIVSRIQVNLRQYFPTTTIRPFFANLPLAYNRKLSEYPVATVLMSQKKFLEAQLKTDALAYNVQRRISVLEKVLDRKTIEEKKDAAAMLFAGKAKEATFSICSIGNVIMPEQMLRYITEFYPVVPPALFPYGISTINFKGELVITVSSASREDGTGEKFAALLKQYGMPAYISENFSHTMMKYNPAY